MLRKLMVLPFILLLSACTTQDTVVRTEIVKVPVPPIVDTVYVSYLDSVVVEGVTVVRTDTVIQVKYFPVEKKFYVKVKPDTITIFDTDTTTITKVTVEETPFLSKVGIFAAGAVFCFVAFVTRKFWLPLLGL